MGDTKEKHAVNAKTVSLVGGGLTLVGLLIGVIPVSTGAGSCGSVLSPSVGVPRVQGGDVAWITPAGCDSLLASMKAPMIVLLVIGGLLIFYGLAKSMRQGFKDRD